MTDLVFRTATRDDLPAMIAMIADDQLGQARDDASLPLDQALCRRLRGDRAGSQPDAGGGRAGGRA